MNVYSVLHDGHFGQHGSRGVLVRYRCIDQPRTQTAEDRVNLIVCRTAAGNRHRLFGMHQGRCVSASSRFRIVMELFRILTRNSALYFGQYSKCRIRIESLRTFVLVFASQAGQRRNSLLAMWNYPLVLPPATL